MRGGDRNEMWDGLAWRAVVLVGAAALTVMAASLTAAALPEGDGRAVSALRGVTVAAVAAACAYWSTTGMRRALSAAGVPAADPFVPEQAPPALRALGERLGRSRRATVAAVLAVGLLLGFLGANLDGRFGPGGDDPFATSGADLAADRDGGGADGGAELSRVLGGGGTSEGGESRGVADAPHRRRADDSDDRTRSGGHGDDDGDGPGPGAGDDDDDDGDDDGDDGGDDGPRCELAVTTSTTIPVAGGLLGDTLPEACAAVDDVLDDAADTVDKTVEDLKTTVTTVLGTVGTTPTTLPPVPTAPPVAEDLDGVVDDLLGSLF